MRVQVERARGEGTLATRRKLRKGDNSPLTRIARGRGRREAADRRLVCLRLLRLSRERRRANRKRLLRPGPGLPPPLSVRGSTAQTFVQDGIGWRRVMMRYRYI